MGYGHGGTACGSRRPRAAAFDMRALAATGRSGALSAAAALTLAVVAGYSDTGSRRVDGGRCSADRHAGGSARQRPQAAQPARVVRNRGARRRRLTETVRALAADRDRLVARIATLERSLEDVTGSIKQQAAAAAAPAAPAAAERCAGPPNRQSKRLPLTPPPQTSRSRRAPAAAPPAAPQPASADRAAPGRTAPAPLHRQPSSAATGEFGVDIGGALNFDGLRALWSVDHRRQRRPVRRRCNRSWPCARTAAPRAVELRLVAGPLTNVESGRAHLRDAAPPPALLPAGRRSKASGWRMPTGAGPQACHAAACSRTRPRTIGAARPSVERRLSGGAAGRAIVGGNAGNPLFRPTARQTNWLLIVGFLALGEALYLRYLAIEHAPRVARLPGRPADLAVHDASGPSSRSTTTACSAGSRSAAAVLNLFGRRSS